MDDNESVKSGDSATISGEYEIVTNEFAQSTNVDTITPALKIANNGDHVELEKNLSEMIYESDSKQNECLTVPQSVASNQNAEKGDDKAKEQNDTSVPLRSIAKRPSHLIDPNYDRINSIEVGKSIFYGTQLSPSGEKQDDMKSERSDTEEDLSDIGQQGSITFDGITSLGMSSIDAPKSEIEIHRKMSELNASHQDNTVGLKVSVIIPSCHEGFVALQDESKTAIIRRFEINRILFFAHGVESSADEACFAFTCQETSSPDTFQCHVFRCNIPEAVKQVSAYFIKAFQAVPASLTTSITLSANESNPLNASITSSIGATGYEFIVSLQIREKFNKNTSSAAARDRTGFKLHCNTDKEIVVTVNQPITSTNQSLHIERCFGVLMCPGKVLRQADMHLLDFSDMDVKAEPTSGIQTMPSYVVVAEWKACDKNFEQLNVETSKTYIGIAIDLVIRAIQEPVRFVLETPVSIHSQNNWMDVINFSKKHTLSQRFYLQLKDNGEGGWEVSSIDPLPELAEPVSLSYFNSTSLFKNFSNKMKQSTSAASIGEDDEASSGDYSSDGDEPLLSGTGDVPNECSDDKLKEWTALLEELKDERNPKNFAPLVRSGIPQSIRNQMWLRLAKISEKQSLMDTYRVLPTQETECESVILRDIHRTFPAHKNFRETQGQQNLLRVTKAYAVYDKEVGYCQGLTFVVASLLLNMPEEEAFVMLVTIMYDYGLRELYKDGFENLHLHLYQLNRLIKDQLPKLYDHFEQIGIETHMYASQWFLTLFTARFPLYFVFHILDVFLLDGMTILFQIALTLHTEFESELRQLDFEGILKYFRITLPKRCRSATLARKLMKKACDRKVKKLKQYKDDYLAQKLLAEKEAATAKQYEQRFEDERSKLRADIMTLRKQLDKTIEQNQLDDKRKTTIIDNYKQINKRQEEKITQLNNDLKQITENVSNCSNCSSHLKQYNTLQPEQTGQEAATVSRVSVGSTASLGPLDPLEVTTSQVKELELLLAQTKLELVEAQCRNQDLTHQMNTLIGEIQSNRSSWQPWLTKTINSIQEKVVSTKRDLPSFQSYTSNSPTSNYNSLERNVDSANTCLNKPNSGRSSLNLMKTDDPNYQRHSLH